MRNSKQCDPPVDLPFPFWVLPKSSTNMLLTANWLRSQLARFSIAGVMKQSTPMPGEGKLIKRIPSLDGLRAISITLVLLGHLYGTRHYPKNAETRLLGSFAHFGVQVFFVISGFLITMLLLKEREKTDKVDLFQFYKRRTIRIFPAAFFYIAVVAILAHPLRDLGYALTYTMSYVNESRPWLLGHLWSLSVEEQFYLFWPLAFALFFSFRKNVAWAVMLLSPLFRFWAWIHGYHRIDEYFPAVADSLAAGCLLACYQSKLTTWRWLTRTPTFVFLCFSTVLCQFALYRVRFEIFLGGLLPVLIALVCFAAVERADWVLNNKVAYAVGVGSYSLYLWQQPFLNRASHAWWTAFPQNILFASIAAFASYWIVEKQFLKLKSRGRKRPGTKVQTATA